MPGNVTTNVKSRSAKVIRRSLALRSLIVRISAGSANGPFFAEGGKEKRASHSSQRRNGKTRLIRRLRFNLRRGQLDQPACCRLHRRNEHSLAPRLLLWCERVLHRALCRSWSRKRPFSQSGNVLDPLSLSAQYLTRKTDNGLVVREIRSVGRRQVRKEKGKYEESYIKHGVGVGSPVGLGAGITNNYHHDYDRGNWNNY